MFYYVIASPEGAKQSIINSIVIARARHGPVAIQLLFAELDESGFRVHAVDDGDGFEADACGSELGATGLHALFDGDADADELGACLLDEVNECLAGFAVGEEVVDDENLVGRLEVRTRNENVVELFVREGVCLCHVLVVGAVDGLAFLGEYDRNIVQVGDECCDGNAACFDGENLVELHIGKTAFEFFADFLHQANINLMVQETVNLKNVAGLDDTIGKDFLLKKVHVKNLAKSAIFAIILITYIIEWDCRNFLEIGQNFRVLLRNGL